MSSHRMGLGPYAAVICYVCAVLPFFSLAFTVTTQNRIPLPLSHHDDEAENVSIDDGDPSVTGVTLKMAFDSSDVWGVADLSVTRSERFTSEESLDLVHRLRKCSDAVLVGRGTVERDDCTLTVRRVSLPSGATQPVRVVLDPNQSLLRKETDGTTRYALLHDGLPTILYHALHDDGSDAIHPSFSDDVVEIIALRRDRNAQVDDDKLFQRYLSPSVVVQNLSQRGIRHVMVEGGSATARAFLEEGMVDRAILIRAPFCFRKPLESNITTALLENAGLKSLGSSTCDFDTVEYWSKPGLPWPTSDLEKWP